MAGVYRARERFGGHEWFAREKIAYVTPKAARPLRAISVSEIYSKAPVLAAPASVEERFKALADKWLDETRYLSSVTQIVLNFSYQQIIGLGPSALPLILARLAEAPNHWFWALSAIAGHNPVKPEHVGNVSAMRDDWLEWASSHGFA